MHFNSHLSHRKGRIWFFAIGQTNLRNERELLQIILLKKSADDGVALRMVNNQIHRLSEAQGNIVRVVCSDRASENLPGRRLWAASSTVIYCILNLSMSPVTYLTIGQHTRIGYNICTLLIGGHSFFFSPAQKMALIAKFGHILRQKSLSAGNVQNHILICERIIAGNFTADSGQVMSLRMKRTENRQHVDCSDEIDAIIKLLFRHIVRIMDIFQDLSSNVPDFAGELSQAVEFIELNRIEVSNTSLITDLAHAVQRLLEGAILYPAIPMMARCATMKVIERIKHHSYLDNANTLESIVQNLLNYRQLHNLDWELIVLPALPQLENVPRQVRPVVLRFCPRCGIRFDTQQLVMEHIVDVHRDEIRMIPLRQIMNDN